eukprot:CCRYP_017586-RA/>CCRYP_017586-RA protein AED:0.16 eAED:0.16 QI:0/-1/0/1/-1/1/1/0/237
MNASSSRSRDYRYNRRIQLPPSQVERLPTSKASTTKFRPKDQNVKRDIAVALALVSVLFKLSTHPMLASIGFIHPNAPKPLSQRDVLANTIKNMALKKYKEKIETRMLFLEAIDHKKCYDFTHKIKAAEDVIIKSNTVSSKNRAKFRPGYKSSIDGIKRNNYNRNMKKNRKKSFSRKIPVLPIEKSPSSTPWTASISSAVMLAFYPPLLKSNMKGSEATNNDNVPKQASKKKLSFPR